MRPEKGKIRLLAALLLMIFPVAPSVRAQENPPPAVEIDASVLDDYGSGTPAPEMPDDGSYPRLLSLQPLRSMIPSLTGPGKRLEKPFPVSRKTMDNLEIFPVQVKEKGSHYAGDFNKMPPVPGRKPGSDSQKSEPESPQKLAAEEPRPERSIPIPPRRPSIQRASSAFVKEARRSYEEDLSKGGIAMPAVPPLAVQEEALSPPPVFKVDAGRDPLGRHLLAPDRAAMVKSVESIAAKNTPPLPPLRKVRVEKIAKTASAIEPAAGLRETAMSVDITEKPDRYMPRRPSAESDAEKEYISMPFAPALSEADEKVLSALDADIVPVMKQNPRWRLQIQAFAGDSADSGAEIDARRTALSRALSVREYLLKNGIDSSRMDVRALGMQTDRAPADRVDFIFFDPEKAE